MNLYLTTTTGFNESQPNPNISLGGYKSSSLVTNDDFDNLFGEVSLMTIKNQRDEYRAIVLCNDYSQPVNKISIHVETPEDGICSYKMALGVMNGLDKYNKPFMENVATVNRKPFHAAFVDMSNDATLDVGTLQAGQQIGLWICRHVDMEKARKQYEDVAEKDPTDPSGRRYRPVNHPTTETVNVVIKWA